MVKLGRTLIVNMTPHPVTWVKGDESITFPSNGKIIVCVDEEEVNTDIPLPVVRIHPFLFPPKNCSSGSGSFFLIVL